MSLSRNYLARNRVFATKDAPRDDFLQLLVFLEVFLLALLRPVLLLDNKLSDPDRRREWTHFNVRLRYTTDCLISHFHHKCRIRSECRRVIDEYICYFFCKIASSHDINYIHLKGFANSRSALENRCEQVL